MSLIKKPTIIFSVLMIVFSFLMVAQIALAADDPNATGAQKAQSGLDTTATKGYGVTNVQLAQNSDVPTIIGRIIGAVLALIGVGFFALLVYAGISWMFAMGKEEQINKSKEMIVGAVLGLMVVLGAYAITAMVSSIFTNIPGVTGK